MIIGIVGYPTIIKNPFENGYAQNIVFFCQFMEKYFSSEHKIIPINSSDFLSQYTHIDLIIQFTPFNKQLADLVKQKYPKCRNVFVKYGHEYYNDLHRLLPKGQNSVCHSPKAYNIDEVWISHHFEPTKYYYQALYNGAEVNICPFIWKPDNLMLSPFTRMDYNDLSNKKHIYIVEPNINILKTGLIPILIVNELWKRNPDSFNKVYIIGHNNYRDNEYFQKELLPKIEVLNGKHNKVFFCPRATVNDIFRKPGILLSHQENCGLNYIYLEALYLKIQWVHNSPFFKDVGYYYTDKNVFEGADKLEKALTDWEAIDNSEIIEKYNPDNLKVIDKYKQLLLNNTLMSNLLPN